MKYCRKTWISRLGGWFLALTLIPLSVSCFIVSISYLMQLKILASFVSLFMGIFFARFGVMEVSFELRKYSITSEGLRLGRKARFLYPWNQIYEIGIFYFDAAASHEVFDKVICCFLHPTPDDIEQILFCNSRFYAQRNQSAIVVIDYDDETMCNLRNVYQKEIKDYTTGIKGYIRNKR